MFGGLQEVRAVGEDGQDKRRFTGKLMSSRRVELPPAFAAILERFARDRLVTFGGQGFGSKALRLDGKIFAMISLRGQFVVKLPRDRVAELIELGNGEYFNTGRSRVMKEWIAILDGPGSWRKLADEAYKYAKAKRPQLTESSTPPNKRQ